ncbi:MAG: FliA/WhiG family RNA polymerase sigma factor [Acidimicrobiales bacterium]|jgi:RNA polymerase sigma factor for flagellar operon FliA
MSALDLTRIERVDELWSSYKKRPDRQTRDRLILHYSPLVKYVAGRVMARLPDSVDQADLVSYGILGLIDAIEKFDIARGVKFETYAVPRIRGAILDELRSIDWVPRSVRAKARAADQAYSKLEHSLRRSPTDEELAGELGISSGELDALFRQTARAGVLQLDQVLFAGRPGERTLGDTIADAGDGPVATVELAETRRMLARSIASLPDRERTVLTLYYYEGLNLSEIGDILGVTESRACQIHTKAVSRLRQRLRGLMG